MRNAFADEVTRLGAEDPRVVLLSGDIGNKLFDKYKDKAEGRFFNCGVAEANMMSVAAGHFGLEKLVCIVDRNRLQQGDRTETTMALGPLPAKFEAFGWAVRGVEVRRRCDPAAR